MIAPVHAPIIPDSAPFTPEQRAWLNGFLASWLAGEEAGAAVAASHAAPGVSPLILFGSQSGNAESLAKKAAKAAQSRGFAARVKELNSIDPATLAAESHVLVVTSTWGEGEMPDNAKEFWEKINNGNAPELKSTRFAVLALGDKNYGDTFCWAGRQIDDRLEKLGGTRLVPRVDCDTDFDQPAAAWIETVLDALEKARPAHTAGLTSQTESRASQDHALTEGYSRKNPFLAPLVAKRCLNKPGSAKDVWHIEFSLEGSGLAYEAGDALGVFPLNNPQVIDALIAQTGFPAESPVPLPDGGEAPLREALLRHYECRKELGAAKTAPSPAEWVASLKRLNPRLYSISSSPKAHPGQIHLTVGAVRYEADGLRHAGVCSTFLADRLAVGETSRVFIQPSKHFRPPADPSRPMIMVGPGTGIAPFRAFLHDRQAAGASGKNWLFFGDQKSATDFLYEDELRAFQKSGLLTRLDTAFSRDQAEKVYVQHRMLEAARDLWAWLEEGAHFYVCGDASRMAKDVDAALHQIVREQGGKSPEDAAAYVKQLKAEHRYQRDVY